MCPHCRKASEMLGRPYMCRTCWRRNYRSKKPVKVVQPQAPTTEKK